MRVLRPIFISVVCVCCAFAAVAQNSPEANALLEKSLAAYDTLDYQPAIKLCQQALDKEYELDTPDTSFLVTVHKFYGSLQLQVGKGNEAYQAYLMSLELAQATKQEELGSIAADLGLVWMVFEGREMDVEPRPTGEETEELFYSIDSILSQSEDTVWAQINVGTWDGLEVGNSVAALSSYRNWENLVEENPELTNVYSESLVAKRGNEEIARGVVVSADLYHAIVRMQLVYPETPELQPWVGDNVLVSVRSYPGVYKSILQQLGEVNIFFNDLSSDPLYSMRHLRHGDSPVLERAILKQLVSDVQQTAESIRDIPEDEWAESWLEPIPGGRFKGLNIIEAMEQTNFFDVYAFLDFVQAFPGKYMGHHWKINETYATWIINDTPEGENFSKWIIDELKKADESGTLEDVLPDLQIYLGDSVLIHFNKRINEYFGEQDLDRAMEWSRLLETLGKALGDTSWMHEAWNNIGFAYDQQENHLKAIEYYTKILREDPNDANALYNRSNAYYAMEQYDLAIADMKVITDIFPTWADGYGNVGWYYMLDGNLEKSWEYTRKAYKLDSLSRAWSVNLGHLYLFDNKPEKARGYYLQALELLESEDEYDLGLKKDFETFLEKGWQTNLVQQEKDWADQQYESIYHPYLKALTAQNKGKELEAQEQYAEALPYFEKASREEQSSAKPRKDWLRVYATWIGFCHQKLEHWEEAEIRYQQAVKWCKELGNEANLVNDLELLGWLFKDKGDQAKSDAYYEEAAAISRRLEDEKRSNSLYILSIGVDHYDHLNFDYAASDAQDVADLFEEKSRALFDYTYKTVLTNANATRSAIEEAFRNVIIESKPGDTFILFFAGQSEKQNDEFYFLPSGITDTDSNRLDARAISANLLRTWVNSMQASRQYIALDAAATSFINTYVRLISLDQGLLDLDKDIMLFSPFTPRIEKRQLGHSVLVNSLLKGLNGDANLGVPSDSMITVREMDAYLFHELGSRKYYYKNQSYAHGMDFKLAFAQKSSYSGIDTSAPEIVIIDPTATRGGMVETSEPSVLLQGKIFDVSPLESVHLNGKTIELTQNGKFSQEIPLSLGVNTLVVMAQDAKGNIGKDSLEVKRIVRQEDTRKTTISFGSREGVDIALLFATNEYDEWSNLSNPVPDAEAIRKDLEELYGFKVELVTDATRKEILEYIRRYQARSYNDNDRLFIFFAGHGVYDEVSKEGYIVAKDSKKGEEIKDFSYVPYSYLRDNVNNIPCKHILLVMDVCFGGTFDKRTMGSRGDFEMSKEEKNAFIQRTLRTKTRLFMTSGSKEYVPDGRPGSHSPFAARVLEALRVTGPNTGLISFNDLIKAVETLTTTPRFGDFGDNEPGSNFVFNYQPVAQQGSIVQKEANLK